MHVRERVRRHIRDVALMDDFADDESFLAGGVIDSLGLMHLLTCIEAEFSVRVTEAELVPENFDSVEKVSAFITRKVGT